MKQNKYTNHTAHIRGESIRKKIYEFVSRYIQENGYAPVYREICEAVGRSPGCISKHLNILYAQGILETDYSKSSVRNIYLPKAVNA